MTKMRTFVDLCTHDEHSKGEQTVKIRQNQRYYEIKNFTETCKDITAVILLLIPFGFLYITM